MKAFTGGARPACVKRTDCLIVLASKGRRPSASIELARRMTIFSACLLQFATRNIWSSRRPS